MKRFAAFFFAVLLLAPLLALAQGKPEYTELKPPLPVDSDGRIQVLEFFWYGCIHCYNLEPTVEKWEKALPKDVEFRRVPAIFNDRWALDAQIFYSFEALSLLDKLHRPFFDAIHRDHLRTDNPQALAEWLQKQGVDPKKFNDVMKSFGVQSRTRRAAQLTAAYKIDGTPELAVQGRYTVSAEQGHTQQGMFDAVNYLVGQLRQSGKK
ncbi:MAG TPA: thiol:disulfide interchange protein DsbA/DsbL [Burkholderiales bacterium]